MRKITYFKELLQYEKLYANNLSFCYKKKLKNDKYKLFGKFSPREDKPLCEMLYKILLAAFQL